MPRLVDMTIDKARALAARDGFVINVVQTQAINDVPPNVIASQDVPAGTTINADHSVTVNVVVSTGGGLANVPAMINQDFVTANQALIKAGFDVKIVYMEQLDSADNGHIIQQDPPAGTPLEKGNTVTVTLSVPGEVPDTEGMDLRTAQNTLLNAGYTPGNVTLTTEGADGKVVRTEPEAGTAARPGTEVSIYVNSANAQPPRL
jgi:serine/threonine-protein kinase